MLNRSHSKKKKQKKQEERIDLNIETIYPNSKSKTSKQENKTMITSSETSLIAIMESL